MNISSFGQLEDPTTFGELFQTLGAISPVEPGDPSIVAQSTVGVQNTGLGT